MEDAASHSAPVENDPWLRIMRQILDALASVAVEQRVQHQLIEELVTTVRTAGPLIERGQAWAESPAGRLVSGLRRHAAVQDMER